MKQQNIFIVAILATMLLVTPALSSDIFAKPNKEKEPKEIKENKGKDKDKVKNCNVQAQVKIFGAANGTTVTTQLETLIPQTKEQTKSPEEPVTFNFKYKKGDVTCPIKEELPKTVYGTANGEFFSGIIKSLTGNNKITYELQGIQNPIQ